MFENWIVPYIQNESGQSKRRYTKVINTFGMSESILDDIEEEICNELGTFVFSKSEETLENIISNIFKKNAITLAVAESCTGGLVSNLLTSVQGSSAFFLGGIVSYSNKIKKDLLNVSEKLITEYGVISAEVAKAMASGLAQENVCRQT
jgi:nicotinamide-nucleotide amidase